MITGGICRRNAAYLSGLFLIKRDFRQDGRLYQVFGFFRFLVRIYQLATGIDQARGDEDDQVAFDVLF